MQATRGTAGRFSHRASETTPPLRRPRRAARPRSRRGGHRIAPARRDRHGHRRAAGRGRAGEGVDDPGRPGEGQRRAGLMAAPRFVSGGSVANTTAGIAELGGRAGFVGAVADDEVGRTYSENLRAAGVEFEPHLQRVCRRRRSRNRSLRRPHHRGRRPHHGHLPRRGVHPVARRASRRPSSPGPRSSSSRGTSGTCRPPRRRCATPRPPRTSRRARWRCRCRIRSAWSGTSASSSTCCSTTSTSCSATRRR